MLGQTDSSGILEFSSTSNLCIVEAPPPSNPVLDGAPCFRLLLKICEGGCSRIFLREIGDHGVVCSACERQMWVKQATLTLAAEGESYEVVVSLVPSFKAVQSQTDSDEVLGRVTIPDAMFRQEIPTPRNTE